MLPHTAVLTHVYNYLFNLQYYPAYLPENSFQREDKARKTFASMALKLAFISFYKLISLKCCMNFTCGIGLVQASVEAYF